MSNEFNPQELLEDIEKGILEFDQPVGEATSWIGMNPTYKPTDGTSMKVGCNCSGWGDDEVCSDGPSDCSRTFKLGVEYNETIVHSETFTWPLPGCHSCLKEELSSAEIVKDTDSGNFRVGVKLCTIDGCTELSLPITSIGMPTDAAGPDSEFKVNVELVPMISDDILTSAEQEGNDANAIWPEDADLKSLAGGLYIPDRSRENLGL